MKENGNGLTLYHFPTSYYSQRVVIALHEKKINFSSKIISPLSMEQYETWFLELNPRGQVPILQDGMRVVPDSNRILEYLDDNFTNDSHRRLFPKEAETDVKQKIEHYIQLIDSIPAFILTFGSLHNEKHISNPAPPLSLSMFRNKMKNGVGQILGTISNVIDRPDLPESVKSTLEEKHKKVADDLNLMNDEDKYEQVLQDLGIVLDDIEAQLSASSENNWLCSSDFTVADIYLAVLLHRIRVIGLHDFLWKQQAQRPFIEKYYYRVMQRESVQLATALPKFITLLSSPTSYLCSFDSRYLAAAVGIGALLVVGVYFFKKK